MWYARAWVERKRALDFLQGQVIVLPIGVARQYGRRNYVHAASQFSAAVRVARRAPLAARTAPASYSGAPTADRDRRGPSAPHAALPSVRAPDAAGASAFPNTQSCAGRYACRAKRPSGATFADPPGTPDRGGRPPRARRPRSHAAAVLRRA